MSRAKQTGRSILSEHESKQLIAAWGVPVTKEALASSSDEAVAAANEIGYPVAMKIDSPDLLHKTEAGVVKLGINNDEGIRRTFDDLMSTAQGLPSGNEGESAAINGVLVQEMVAGAVEVIVGVSYDAQLGPVLLFGTGGIMVEVYRDVAFRLCPIDVMEAREMIDEVKGSRLLHGFRGQPPTDVDALAHTLAQVSQLAVNLEGTLGELDINPLMVLPEGKGVKAADALVVFKE